MIQADFGGVGKGGEWLTVNADSSGYRPLPDMVADISASSKQLDRFFKKGELDAIRCIHTLEHLPAWDILPTLRYWGTFLKPGGTLLIVVPDLESMMEDVMAERIPFEVFAAVAYVPGSRTRHGASEEHRWGWNRTTLIADLLDAGYRGFHDGDDSDWEGTWTLDFEDVRHTGLVGRYQVPNLRMKARKP